jgi:hypothetical protein
MCKITNYNIYISLYLANSIMFSILKLHFSLIVSITIIQLSSPFTDRMVNMGYSRKEIEESLLKNKYDEITATYLLLGRRTSEVSQVRCQA